MSPPSSPPPSPTSSTDPVLRCVLSLLWRAQKRTMVSGGAEDGALGVEEEAADEGQRDVRVGDLPLTRLAAQLHDRFAQEPGAARRALRQRAAVRVHRHATVDEDAVRRL